MPLIEWNETFSVDKPEIDKQHQKWISLINELHESLVKADAKELPNIAADTLAEMREYVRYHFAQEEEYMRQINYPGLSEHRKIHADFYVRILNYYNDVQEGKIVLNTEIMKTLRNWLEDHIINEDKKYSRFAVRRES